MKEAILFLIGFLAGSLLTGLYLRWFFRRTNKQNVTKLFTFGKQPAKDLGGERHLTFQLELDF